MSSIKQKQANQQNAQKSTGPRTLQGKAVSRFNALKTGMDAVSQVIPGEDPTALANLAEEYQQRWQPALPEQRVLVDTLVHDEWQLRRLRKAEATHWRYRLQKDPFGLHENKFWNGSGGNDFARLQRRMDSTERSYRLTLEKLEFLAERAADLPVGPPPAPGPVQEFPDLHEPIAPQNQPVNPGIGFVPSTPAATSRRPLSSLPRPSVVAISAPGLPVLAPNPANRA